MKSIHRILLGVLLGLLAVSRLSLALADHRWLLGTELYSDDAFYYLKVAGNVAAGRGLTFDGLGPTNGFHPLYLAQLVPLVALSGADRIQPIHLSAGLLGLWAVATGAVLYRLVRGMAGPAMALWALGIWTVSPYFVASSVNGLETGIALFFTVACTDLYLRWFRGEGPATPRRAAVFGLLAGLGLLARSDFALLLAALVVDWVLVGRVRGRLGLAALAALAALGTWLPWGVYSRQLTGHWLPLSGAASAQQALYVGWGVDLPRVWSNPKRFALFDPVDPPAAFYADVGTKLAGLFLLESPLLAPLRMGLPFSMWPDVRLYAPFEALRRDPLRGVLVLGSVLALAAALVLRARRRSAAPQPGPAGLGRIAGIYLALVMLGYTLYCPAHWYGPRYLAAAVLLSTAAGLVRLARMAARGRPARVLVALVLVALVLLEGASLHGFLQTFRRSGLPSAGLQRAWEDLSPHIPPGQRIGAFQAGIYSWFSGLDIVNLDGKVNAQAYRALRDRQMHLYLQEAGVRYVVEWEWLFWALCLRFTPPGSLDLQKIAGGGGPFEPTLFRLGPPPQPP